ncbi:MAG TPA: class I SAM-dependent methyltransferase [Solirubrobacteraceae bacterium]|jgi:tRNA (cmo5U34)-methyltransferase
MSRPVPEAAWQQPHLAVDFLDRRHILLPLLDVQEDLIRRLLTRHGRPIERFLDLGCGDGAMADLVFDLPGRADLRPEAVLVDFSEPMLERARARLTEHGGRWETRRGDLNDPGWHQGLSDGRFDAVVSGLAIHHIAAERKRELFAEVLALLAPGGIFVNMDYVEITGPLRGVFDEQMRANALHAEHERGGTRSAEEVDFEDNEDRPDTAQDQLQWLREAGFEQCEVHFKWAEAAVFGGVKPVAA